MNLISLYYFVEIARDKSISKAAKRMHITQQALSVHMQKLERYYETTLFERKPTFALTYTGELLLEVAERMLLLDSNIRRQLHEIENHSVGQLKIGASSNILSEYLPEAIRRFRLRWPNVLLQINMETFDSKVMRTQLENGTLDLVVYTKLIAPSEDDSYTGESQVVYTDQMFFVVPRLLMDQHFGADVGDIIDRNKDGLLLSDFKDFPVILLRKDKAKRELADDLFENAGLNPHIAMEVTNSEQIIPLLPLNIGAFFCDGVRLNSFLEHHHQNYYAFPLSPRDYKRKRVLCIDSDIRHYQNDFAKDFVEIVKTVFNEMYIGSHSHAGAAM